MLFLVFFCLAPFLYGTSGDTLPHPKIVLLGPTNDTGKSEQTYIKKYHNESGWYRTVITNKPTGVGKSTLGNSLSRNDKGRSVVGQQKYIKKYHNESGWYQTVITYGEWEEWSSFGPCSKTCVSCLEQPGLKQRKRTCKLPQNGGQPCQGMAIEEKTCARRCPIDARWSSWPSDWSSCSGNCKKRGEPAPYKSRSRTCLPGAFGGKNCSFLEDQARTNNELLYSEVQACSELPNCPRPATIGPWGEWSSCTQTCYPDRGTIPKAQRTRICQEASLSSENSLNDGIFTCKDLKVRMSRNCEVSACQDICSYPWTSLSHGCYLFIIGSTNWAETKNTCENLHAHLVQIETEEENEELYNEAVRRDMIEVAPWIGLNDIAEEGNWVWTDGNRANFTNWSTNQPDNAIHSNREGEDCAVLNTYTASTSPGCPGCRPGVRPPHRLRKWNDYPCNKGQGVICELNTK